MTMLEDESNKSQPDNARFLFNSMVISPGGRKRSTYLVWVEGLADVLDSLGQEDMVLEHLFDY